MQTGAVQAAPQNDPEQSVRQGRIDAAAIEHEHHCRRANGRGGILQMDPSGVKQRQNRSRDEIIDDNRRSQENPQLHWTARAQQRDQRDREGCIGGCWDRPSRGKRAWRHHQEE
jgi:hypothetical protein